MNMITFLFAFTAISTLLFAYYFIFLRNEKQFQGNRFFLLAILPISAILPLLEFSLFQANEISPIIGTTLETITITSEGINGWAWNHTEILGFIYLSITFCLLLLLIIRLSSILRHIRTSFRRGRIKGATIIHAKGPIDISSFGPYIIWNTQNELSEAEKTQIISHELCHVKQHHSLDILFLELWKVVFWFHPMVYLMGRELKVIHEYQADQAALQKSNRHSYIELLLSQTLGQSLQLSHSFYQLPIKNRIMMLMRKPNTQWTIIKYAMIIPLACALFIACTSEFEKDSSEVISVEDVKQENIVNVDNIFIDSILATNNYLPVQDLSSKTPKAINLNEIKRMIGYPQICRDAGIQGQVLLRILIDKSGNYKEHEVLTEGHKILREAVEKHIDKLNFTLPRKNEKPVAFYVNIPFNFVLLN